MISSSSPVMAAAGISVMEAAACSAASRDLHCTMSSRHPPEHADLLATEEELAAWARAERGRIPGVEATSGRLEEVRDLREHIRRALFTAAEARPAPPEAVEAINAASAAAPTCPGLRAGRREEEMVSDDPFARSGRPCPTLPSRSSPGRVTRCSRYAAPRAADAVPAQGSRPEMVLRCLRESLTRRPSRPAPTSRTTRAADRARTA